LWSKLRAKYDSKTFSPSTEHPFYRPTASASIFQGIFRSITRILSFGFEREVDTKNFQVFCNFCNWLTFNILQQLCNKAIYLQNQFLLTVQFIKEY